MTPSRIAFDSTIARLGRAGPAVYITSLIPALEPLLGDRLHVLASRWASPLDARRTLADRTRTLVRDLWWHQAGVTRAARRASCDLLHLPAGIGPVHSSLPLVVTVHDATVLRYPMLFRPWQRTYARVVLGRLARTARAVMTGSHASKVDLVERLSLPEERVTVIPYGAPAGWRPTPRDSDEAADVGRRYGLPARFVLTVGSVEPRKNLPRLLEAVGRLRAGRSTRELTLIHAGPAGWLADEVPRLVRRLGLEDGVRFLGYVPPRDLMVLYGLAEACAYPSLWEGFGLPVVEAMACGCPVLAARTGALPEVGGDATLLVDPESVDEITAGLERLWLDDALRACLARRGTLRAREYTWARTARETVAVYARALG